MAVSTHQRALWCRCFLITALLHKGALPQTGSPITAANRSGNTQPSSIAGQTINAVTGQPVSRVLVRYGMQAMLTDYQGMFHFDPEMPGNTVSALKPGYSMSEDAGDAGPILSSASFSSGPVQVRLYPEAILTGSVRSPEGDPLPGVVLTAHRSLYDESGHHWVQAAVTRTDSHGEFRLPLAPGEYRLQTVYTAPTATRKEAILPVVLPDHSSSGAAGFVHLRSGETQRVELRPQVSPVTAVTARVEPEAGFGNVRLQVEAANGASFQLRHTGTGTPGEMKMEMPRGSYLLEATRQSPEGSEQGQTRLTVGATEVTGVPLQLSPVNRIPIEIAGDRAATSDNMLPTAAQLGLSLEDTDPASGTDEGLLRVVEHGGPRAGPTAFFNPPPGSYRLRARSGGEWYIVSATNGANDLLRQYLTTSPGVGSAPLRIVVSNQTASLAGTVRLNGQPAAAWVYLLADTPSATPVVIVRAGVDGRFSRSALPPGSYRALAFEYRHSIDFEAPQTLANLSNVLQTVTLNAGDKGTLDLEITPYTGAAQ